MGNKTDIKYLSPVDIELRQQNKYCRFKKMGIKYIDYKDPDFLMRFLNEQGKILPRRITGNSLKFQRHLAVAVKRARQIAENPHNTEKRTQSDVEIALAEILNDEIHYSIEEDQNIEEVKKDKKRNSP